MKYDNESKQIFVVGTQINDPNIKFGVRSSTGVVSRFAQARVQLELFERKRDRRTIFQPLMASAPLLSQINRQQAKAALSRTFKWHVKHVLRFERGFSFGSRSYHFQLLRGQEHMRREITGSGGPFTIARPCFPNPNRVYKSLPTMREESKVIP